MNETPDIIVLKYTTARGLEHFVRGPAIVGDIQTRVRGDVAAAQVHGDPIARVAVLNLTAQQYQDLPTSHLTGRIFPATTEDYAGLEPE